MEQEQLDLTQITAIFRRRKWWIIVPFLTIVSIVAVVAVVLPDIYKSTATIMVQDSQISQQVVQSTVTSYADQRIQAITQEITSRTRLLGLVEKYDLLPRKREVLSSEELVAKVEKRIKIETVDAEIKKETQNKPVLLTIAFRLSYEDEDPKKAQLVANEMASYYMTKNLEQREKRVRTTSQFLEDQLRQAKDRLEELETKLAIFREEHLEELPEFTSLNMQKLEKLNGDIGNIGMQLRSIEEQKATIKGNLAQVDPFTRAGAGVLSNEERVQQAMIERATLAGKYSDKHPLVQAKDREIANLEEKFEAGGRLARLRDKLQDVETKLSALRGKYTDQHPAVVSKMHELENVKRELEDLQSRIGKPAAKPTNETPTNPAYLALKADVDKLEVSAASLRSEKERLEQQVSDVYEKLHSSPQVSKEYNELTTDYQSAKTHYSEIQQKYFTSQVARGMEEDQLGESFQVVEPAFLPEKPYKPNRLAIVLIGIVLGMGFSVGLASLKEYSDKSVRDAKGLEQLSGRPVLSVIPTILTDEDRMRAKRRRIAAATSAVCAVSLGLIVFHYYIMDLDVFYAKLLRFFEKNMPI